MFYYAFQWEDTNELLENATHYRKLQPLEDLPKFRLIIC